MGTATPADEVLQRLLGSVNAHRLDDLVACFAEDYLNETPAHPQRGFRGRDQVRKNWSEIFSQVPDLRARVHRTAAHGDTLWTEWEMAGTRHDGAPFLMRGVVIFGALLETYDSRLDMTGLSTRYGVVPTSLRSWVQQFVRESSGAAAGAGGQP